MGSRNLKNIIADEYFAPRFFEKRLYEFLGIRKFKRFVLSTFGRLHRYFNLDKEGSNYFIGREITEKNLKKFEKRTRFNELVHAPFFGIFGFLLAYDLANENYGLAFADGIFFLSNAYSSMLQRYNRGRIYRTLENLLKKKNLNKTLS